MAEAIFLLVNFWFKVLSIKWGPYILRLALTIDGSYFIWILLKLKSWVALQAPSSSTKGHGPEMHCVVLFPTQCCMCSPQPQSGSVTFGLPCSLDKVVTTGGSAFPSVRSLPALLVPSSSASGFPLKDSLEEGRGPQSQQPPVRPCALATAPWAVLAHPSLRLAFQGFCVSTHQTAPHPIYPIWARGAPRIDPSRSVFPPPPAGCCITVDAHITSLVVFKIYYCF